MYVYIYIYIYSGRLSEGGESGVWLGSAACLRRRPRAVLYTILQHTTLYYAMICYTMLYAICYYAIMRLCAYVI